MKHTLAELKQVCESEKHYSNGALGPDVGLALISIIEELREWYGPDIHFEAIVNNHLAPSIPPCRGCGSERRGDYSCPNCAHLNPEEIHPERRRPQCWGTGCSEANTKKLHKPDCGLCKGTGVRYDKPNH